MGSRGSSSRPTPSPTEGFFPWEHEHQVNPLVPWVVQKEATCSEAGVEINYCLICKQTIERDIPATGQHVFDRNLQCTLCHRYRLVCASESHTAPYGDTSDLQYEEAHIVTDRSAAIDLSAYRVEYFGFATLSHVGRTANTFSVRVYDREGNNVTGNFIVERIFGTLELGKREIVIRTESAEKPYDGTPLVCMRWTAEGLAEGDQIVDVLFGEGQTDYGWRSNEIIGFRIVNALGEDVTAYYAVRMEWGKLTVRPEEN